MSKNYTITQKYRMIDVITQKNAQITITGTYTVTELCRKLGAITELRRKKTPLRNYAKVFSRLKLVCKRCRKVSSVI